MDRIHISCKPGEQIEVDWAGDPAAIIDPDTGEIIKAYIFVSVMIYSQYTYVEAFLDMKQRSWINAHIHMYEYFGVLPEFSYRITVRLQLSTMVVLKTNRSMKLIRRWPNTSQSSIISTCSSYPISEIITPNISKHDFIQFARFARFVLLYPGGASHEHKTITSSNPSSGMDRQIC